jgi:hypothetical protein
MSHNPDKRIYLNQIPSIVAVKQITKNKDY